MFGCGSTSMYISCKVEGPRGSMTKHLFIIFGGRKAYLGLNGWVVPHIPKILVMAQSNGSFWEK
jgi:hypothetical protein